MHDTWAAQFSCNRICLQQLSVAHVRTKYVNWLRVAWPTPCAVNYTGKNSASQLQHILQLQNIAKNKINEFIIKTKTKNKILFHKSF